MMQQLAEMAILYPERESKHAEFYLTGISKRTLMKVTTHLLGKDFFDDKETIEETVASWFQPGNTEFARDLLERIHRYIGATPLKIVNRISCLQILQMGLVLAEDSDSDAKSELESEKDLMFAMLTLNSNQDYNQTKDTQKIRELYPDEDYLAALLLHHQFPIFDLVNFHFQEYTACQLIKSLLLFRFLEKSDEGKALLQRFCNHLQVASWKEYYERFMPLIIGWANRKNASSVDIILERNEHLEDNQRFLTQLALIDYNNEVDQDFKELRGKPLIPLDDVSYRIIHPLFIADKLYKGLYFLLNELNKKDSKIIKGDFRGWYTSNFSENECFAMLLRYAFPPPAAPQFDKDFGIDGAPDGYLRLHADIFLFESKDVFLNAEIKEAYNFERLDEALKTRFLIKPSGPVGIGQLINNIRRCLTMAQPIDKDYDPARVYIYPILITHDRMYDTPGLNQVLITHFKKELKKLKDEGLNTDRVLPVVVINVDAMIEISHLLRNGKITLKEMIIEYYNSYNVDPQDYKGNPEALQNAVVESKISFMDFIYHYLDKKFSAGWRSEDLLVALLEGKGYE